jgi:hypothetical protein
MKFPGRKNQQQALTNGLRPVALRAIKFAGCKTSKLLRHFAETEFTPAQNASGVFMLMPDFLDLVEWDDYLLGGATFLHLEMEVVGCNPANPVAHKLAS